MKVRGREGREMDCGDEQEGRKEGRKREVGGREGGRINDEEEEKRWWKEELREGKRQGLKRKI